MKKTFLTFNFDNVCCGDIGIVCSISFDQLLR